MAASHHRHRVGRIVKGGKYRARAGLTRSMALTSARWVIRNLTVCSWPLCAHLMRGVSIICYAHRQG